jgi:hypothetical protein
MRAQIAFPVILFASLSGSTLTAVAQTGEFASQVPSSVMRNAWEMQDYSQRVRSGAVDRPVSPPAQSYDWSNAGKPAPGGVTTMNGTKAQR